MILLNHLNPEHTEKLKSLGNKSPFQFSKGFTLFYKNFMKENLEIGYSEKLNAFIPIRFVALKLFKLAQILHAPVRNNTELNEIEQQEFFEELIAFFNTNHLCERLIQPHPYGILGAVPANARFCEFGTYVIDLKNQTSEEIFDKFHPKYQKAIQHTVKNNGIVRFGKQVLNDFYGCYSATMARIHMPCESLNYFESLYNCLGDDHVTAGVIYDMENPIGGIFLLHTEFAALCTHAGSMGESKLYGSMKHLHFEMMKRMQQLGVNKYDLVGVRIGNNDAALEGVFRFKKGFGGDLKKGFLWKIDINPIRAKMYDILVKIKHPNSKFKDIIDQVTI
jgi:hypothetical protein